MADELKNIVLDMFKSWSVSYESIIKNVHEVFAEDGVWNNGPLPQAVGPAGCAEVWQLCYDQMDLRTIDVEVLNLWSTGRYVIAERIDNVKSADGSLVCGFPICGVIKFNDENKIEHWTEYFDSGPVLASMGQDS